MKVGYIQCKNSLCNQLLSNLVSILKICDPWINKICLTFYFKYHTNAYFIKLFKKQCYKYFKSQKTVLKTKLKPYKT